MESCDSIVITSLENLQGLSNFVNYTVSLVLHENATYALKQRIIVQVLPIYAIHFWHSIKVFQIGFESFFLNQKDLFTGPINSLQISLGYKNLDITNMQQICSLYVLGFINDMTDDKTFHIPDLTCLGRELLNCQICALSGK